eukprot:366555-Chlamydomonas_euryale.AAC.27
MPGVRPSVRPPAVPGGFRPAPLRLDAQGREIDENGNLVVRAVQVGRLRGPAPKGCVHTRIACA